MCRLYYARGCIIVIQGVLEGVDAHYTLLQGHAILRDVIPLLLVLDDR